MFFPQAREQLQWIFKNSLSSEGWIWNAMAIPRFLLQMFPFQVKYDDVLLHEYYWVRIPKYHEQLPRSLKIFECFRRLLTLSADVHKAFRNTRQGPWALPPPEDLHFWLARLAIVLSNGTNIVSSIQVPIQWYSGFEELDFLYSTAEMIYLIITLCLILMFTSDLTFYKRRWRSAHLENWSEPPARNVRHYRKHCSVLDSWSQEAT